MVPLTADGRRARASATTLAPSAIAVLAAVTLGWALVTGPGIGTAFLPSAFLLGLAALASWNSRGTGASRPARPTSD